jgi:peptidoglycan hydrolase-like protein with peptidoglycan-binding domain/DNA invertase Pin-like site-specific DNA recombinase
MRTTYCLPGARRRGFSLVAGLAVLCLAGTMVVGSSPARAAEAPRADTELLTLGDGYAQPQGSLSVRALQRRLRTLGLRPGPVDGFFGPKTEAAVERFQLALSLRVDGIVGDRTRQALGRAKAPMLVRGTGYGWPGGSVRVRRLQRQLRSLEMRPGPVDGLYGPLTAAAVARFQRERGFRPDGVAWPGTRRAIAARRLAETRLASVDRAAASPKGESVAAPLASDGPMGDALRAAPSSGAASPRQASDMDVGLLALGGLLAFMLVAAAAPLVRKVVVEPAGAVGGAYATLSAVRPNGASSETTWPPAVPEPEAGSAWREQDDGAVEVVGYVTAAEPRHAKAELRRQITAMDAACARDGWRLVEVARDVGEAAGFALDRPGLNYAFERLAGSDRPCLVVTELRRLGGSAAELGRVLRWLRDRSLRLVALDVELDTASADGRIAADALISVGERAEQDPRKRRADGEAGDARPGRPAVRDLPELTEYIAAMRSAGMTLQAIADRLNTEGVPTVRGGREWRPSSVQVAAGYRRPRRLLSTGQPHDGSAQRRRAEER